MNKSSEVIVFRSRESGEFLRSYKDRGTLAFEASYCCLTHCLKLIRENYEEDEKKYKALAKAFDCEIVVVEIDYKLSYPNDAEVEPIENGTHKIEKMMDDLFELLKGE